VEPTDYRCVISALTIGACTIVVDALGVSVVIQWIYLRWGVPLVMKHHWVAC